MRFKRNKNKTRKYFKKYKKIEKHFYSKLKKLSAKNIAQNLLIFTLFPREKPMGAIDRLIDHIATQNSLNNELIILKKIKIIYLNFLREVYKNGLNFYKKNNFNTHYLIFGKSLNGEIKLDARSTDASTNGFRSGNTKYEYKNLLKKIIGP